MIKNLSIFLCLIAVFCVPSHSSLSAQNPAISISPAHILQGDPFMVQITGTSTLAAVKKITFQGKSGGVFLYKQKLTALFGVDLNATPATDTLTVTFADGQVLSKKISISARDQAPAPLGIPADLGGDTSASDTQMVNNLIAENKTLANIPTAKDRLWIAPFAPPLQKIVVTDPYGYSRQTGVYQIPHKGVDYRAAIGTPVMAINRGVVRLVADYTDYGNIIVVDHGQGIMSFYLHLSKINVKVGDIVQQGQTIGLSGQTGYALGPHLHLSIRINGISIDPVKFLSLFS